MGVKEVFDKSAKSYDQSRWQLIPCFDDFYGMVLEQIPYQHEAKIRVLDLGAGTGLLSLFIAQAFPKAKITLIDISEEMLKKARERLEDQIERFVFVVSDYAKEPISEQFDVVVSALSIHHLTEEQKPHLFQEVYRILTPGGAFINADQVLGATPEIERRYREVWLSQVRERGVTASDLVAALERMKEDRMSTLESQLHWLREAGFHMVNCWYKNYRFVVYGGYK